MPMARARRPAPPARGFPAGSPPACRRSAARHSAISARRARGRPVSATSASRSAKRRREASAAPPVAGGSVGCSTSVPWKLPRGLAQGRPRRPRAAVCSPREDPGRAGQRRRRRRSASALVLSISAQDNARHARRPGGRQRTSASAAEAAAGSIPNRLTTPSTIIAADGHQQHPVHRRHAAVERVLLGRRNT